MRKIELTEMKKRLVEMVEYLDKLCDENGLTLYMAGGTLLGAVRHKGFIPWDDDIDMHLTRPDYDKLIEVFRNNGNCGRYKLLVRELNGNYLYPFAKLVDTQTLLIEKGGDAGVEMGLYVDIFPVDGLGNDIKTAKKHMKKLNKYITLNLAVLVKPWRKEVSFVKNFAIAFLRVIAKLYGGKRLYSKMYKLAHSLPYDECKYVGEVIDAVGEKRVVEREAVYSSYVVMPFENIQLKAPVGWDNYMSRYYGDYMQLPPESQRVPTHGYELYDKNSAL